MKKLNFVLGLSLLLVGCAGDPVPTSTGVTEAPPVSGAITTASTLTIVAPKSVIHGTDPTIAATVVDDDTGRPSDVTHQVSWSSSNLLVFTVSDGHLYTIGPGTAMVRAMYGEQSTSFEITVVEKSIVGLNIMADAETAAAGDTLTWSLIAKYNDDSVVDVTHDATWTSSDESIATLDGPGQVRAIATGMATIVAAYDGQKTAVPFQVQ